MAVNGQPPSNLLGSVGRADSLDILMKKNHHRSQENHVTHGRVHHFLLHVASFRLRNEGACLIEFNATIMKDLILY